MLPLCFLKIEGKGQPVTAVPRLSNRLVSTLEVRPKAYFVWDDALAGFGLRVYPTGRMSYLIQYRVKRRTRRYTLGYHGELTAEKARLQAMSKLGDVAEGGDPAEKRRFDREGITVRELCERYLLDAELGLIPGKRGPKKPSTLRSDRSRMEALIIPLLGTRLVKDIGRAEVSQFMRDVASGKPKRDVRTKARGRSIVRGGLTTAGRTAGLLGGILTYAVRNGIIDSNPVHGIPKPATRFRRRRLSEQEYKQLGEILISAEKAGHNAHAIAIIRLLALTGCRRGEIEKLRWEEVDFARQCLQLADTKEGRSIRPLGAAALSLLKGLHPDAASGYVFEGAAAGKPFDGLQKVWDKTIKGRLEGVTPHVLRHSFASTANDLGYTEATIAAMLGHAAGTTTSRYMHHLDSVLVAAADRVSTHIAMLMGAQEAQRKALESLFAKWGVANQSWNEAVAD